MKDPKQGLGRAARITPAGDRPRYTQEWQADLARAEELGLPPEDVVHGATRMALTLRRRQLERLLLGGYGTAPTALTWLVVFVAVVVAFLLGGILVPLLLLFALVGAGVLARAGSPSHWIHWLTLASLAVGGGSFSFFWWALGASIDAADTYTPVPPLALWGGTALILFGISVVTMIISAVAAVTRERRLHPPGLEDLNDPG
jgi:hypothetical protein